MNMFVSLFIYFYFYEYLSCWMFQSCELFNLWYGFFFFFLTELTTPNWNGAPHLM